MQFLFFLGVLGALVVRLLLVFAFGMTLIRAMLG
jgi:hypothetical protein